MPNMSGLQRTELNAVKNSRAIRVAIYDAAILIGAFLAADHVYEVWPEYAYAGYVLAFGTLMGALIHRINDWRAIERIEGIVESND
jgi:hypothetical protein